MCASISSVLPKQRILSESSTYFCYSISASWIASGGKKRRKMLASKIIVKAALNLFFTGGAYPSLIVNNHRFAKREQKILPELAGVNTSPPQLSRSWAQARLLRSHWWHFLIKFYEKCKRNSFFSDYLLKVCFPASVIAVSSPQLQFRMNINVFAQLSLNALNNVQANQVLRATIEWRSAMTSGWDINPI